jgi:hypothetical protein
VPKIPKPAIAKKPATTGSKPLPLRELASELDQCRIDLSKVSLRLDALCVALYTKGLTERGPIVEGSDDCPF